MLRHTFNDYIITKIIIKNKFDKKIFIIFKKKKEFDKKCRILIVICKRTVEEGGETMKITDVRVRKVTEEGKMKAIVSVTFDEEFVVHDIKVIEGQNGLFIAMPSRKMADGEFRDIAHPINATTRQKIQEAVFEEYEKALTPE